jgi:Putative DNA-binding domain
MNLAELQRAMRRALHDSDPAALLPEIRGGVPGPAQRLQIYADMYVARQVASLAEDFPLVRRLLGAAPFERLAFTHLKRRPSRSPSLSRLGEGFEETLAGLGLEREAQVARLEWARVESFWAPDAQPLSGADLGALGERFGEAVLQLHPSLRLVQLWPGVLDYAAGGDAGLLDSAGAISVVVFRKGEAVLEVQVPPAEAEALRRVLQGRTAAEVCEAFASEPEPAQAALRALSEWVADQWLAR